MASREALQRTRKFATGNDRLEIIKGDKQASNSWSGRESSSRFERSAEIVSTPILVLALDERNLVWPY